MNKKIFGVVTLVGVLILLGAGCAKNTEAPATGGISKLLSGQLTDENKCVELMAHVLVAYQYTQKLDMAAVEVISQKVDSLKKQYGWSDDEVTKNCGVFSQQKGFMDLVGKRMLELMPKVK